MKFLKKQCIFYILLLGGLVPHLYAQSPSYSYIVKIKLPPTITDAAANIHAYYRGQEFKFDTGCIMLSKKHERLAFSIIITPELEYKAIKNNIRYLKRVDGLPCRWFDLTLSFAPHHNYVWHIEERPLDDVPLRIPDHAIVIQTNPALIDALDEQPRHEDEEKIIKNVHAKVIHFPTIIFKKDLQKKEFEEASIHSLLAACDIRAIHQAAEDPLTLQPHLCQPSSP
jgi:hypothetical protein